MKRAIAAAAVVLLVALAACSANEGTGVTAGDSSRAPGDPHAPAPYSPPGPEYEGNLPGPDEHLHTEGEAILDWSPAPNFAKFVEWSHAAVVGRVTAVGASRWNFPGKTRPPEETFTMEFRDATIEVQEVIYDSPTLPAKAGQALTVRLYGNGSDSGERVEGAEPVRRYNAISGPVAVGDRVLWVLGLAQFPFTDGSTEPIPKLVGDYYGAWRIGADLLAMNVLPARTVPFAALVGRLKAERATPTNGATGARGRVNPLE